MEKPNSFLSMVERLGNVLYWVGCISALPVSVTFYYEEMDKYSDSDSYETGIIIGALFCAIAVWFAGFAVRYVLNGRGLWQKKRNT